MKDYPIKTIEFDLMENSCIVEYKGSTKFKYTITADKDIRIKVPDRFICTVFEKDWVNECKVITRKILELHPAGPELTLRARCYGGSKNNPKLFLRNAGKHVVYIYDMFNETLEKYKKEEV